MKTLASLIILFSTTVVLSAQNKRFDINEEFSGIKEIEVDMVFSDVFVDESGSDKTEVNGYVEWENEKKEYSITTKKSGSTLIVKLIHPNKTKGNCEGKLYITTPKNCELQINTVSGDINVSGVGNDELECNTVSGDIRLNNIACDVELNTVSGDMSVTNIGGDVDTNTVSGDVEINKVKGDFEGNSVSGDFVIRELKGKKSISTLSGDVE